MNDAQPAPVAKPIFRPWTAVAMLGAVVLVGITLFFSDAFGVRSALSAAWAMSGEGKASCSVSGTVIDKNGVPVAGATVRCEWVVMTETGEAYQGMFVRTSDSGGNYSGQGEFNSSSLEKAQDIKVQIKLQAGAPQRDTVPSEPIVWTAAAVSETTKTLQLGDPLPTVPLHAVDTSGRPIQKIWVKCVPVGGTRDDMHEPRLEGFFDDGVVSIPVPQRPFQVKVQVKGTGRRTMVGPFDPTDMPERIDVTLPDH